MKFSLILSITLATFATAAPGNTAITAPSPSLTPSTCAKIGQACYNNECCPGAVCGPRPAIWPPVPGKCAVAPKPACSKVGQECYSSNDCCKGTICGPVPAIYPPVPGKCEVPPKPAPTCAKLNEKCFNNSDCCTGTTCSPRIDIYPNVPGFCEIVSSTGPTSTRTPVPFSTVSLTRTASGPVSATPHKPSA